MKEQNENLLVRDELCEQAVLGSIVNNTGNFNEVREFLTEDSFYFDKHAEIFKAICRVSDRGDAPDIISVSAELRAMNSDITPFELVQTTGAFSIDSISRDALRLKELGMRRRLWQIGTKLSMVGLSESNLLDEEMQYAKESIDNLYGDKESGVSSLRTTINRLYERISRNLSHNGVITGTPTGFSRLDEKGGLQSSSLVIVAGETSQGKTSFALAVAMNAIQADKKIAMYSMEMTNEELTARMVAMKSGVSSSDILYSSYLSAEQLGMVDKSVGKLNVDNLFFDDRSTSNIETILVSIRAMKLKYDIDGAIVDYLQILNVNMKNQNKEQAMGDVARRLKNLAKDLGIWVIALSQLNRDSLNPVPNLNRLRDSGQIAEAADMVAFVYRAEYYNRNFPEPFQNAETKGRAMIDIAKGRNVGTMRFICGFDKSVTRFYDLNDEPEESYPEQDVSPF